jgi:hypothetical protein
MSIFRKNVGDALGGWIAPIRRLRVSILEVMLLVAALAVSFRWPGLSVPVGLLFLYAIAQRRDILGRPTRVALVQVALALYLPPAVGILLFHYVEEGWDLNLERFSLMPNFIPGALISLMLPWFDRSHAPFFAVEIVVLSTMISLGMIGGLGVLARRGRADRLPHPCRGDVRGLHVLRVVTSHHRLSLFGIGLQDPDTKVERREHSLDTLGIDGSVLYHQGSSGRASHILTVPSSLAEASRLPSGLNATLVRPPVFPLRVRVS